MMRSMSLSVPSAAARSAAISSPRSTASMPQCRRQRLRAQFGEGGNGTGDDFGSVLIRNVSVVRCSIKGRLRFSAFSAAGVKDTNTSVARPRRPRTYVLPPRLPRYLHQRDPRGYLDAVLTGADRDDPGQPNGLCRHADEQAPVTLVVGIGKLTFRVANKEPRSWYSQPDSPRPGAVYGCHGSIELTSLIAPADL